MTGARAREVFISYASADEDRAMVICMQLEQLGITCWKAPRDIRAGQRYAEAILEGIAGASIFLLLYSRAAEASPHVANEIEDAASKNKAIVLVKMDDADPSENRAISLFLRSHQWFDASAGSTSSHVDRLASDLHSLLEQQTLLNSAARDQHSHLSQPVPAAAPQLSSSGASSRSTGPFSIGIEVGSTKVRACLFDLGDREAGAPDTLMLSPLSDEMRNPRAVMEEVRRITHAMVDDHLNGAALAGIGVAVPGQVDLRAGTLKFGPNLFGARNLPFKTHLQSAFPRVPVRVDNEIRCATRAELHLGVGKQFDSFACIFVGTGVGSGTVIDRRIHFGHNFCAGEIGHTKIALSGTPCACGQIGCLETFVKSDAVVARAKAKAIDWESRSKTTLLSSEESMTPEHIVDAIDRGDEAAREVADEVGDSLGLGIANYLNLVNPAAVVIGGGLMTGFFFHMIDRMTSAVQRNALAEVANTPIVQSAHADDGIAMGAALMFHSEDGWPFQ